MDKKKSIEALQTFTTGLTRGAFVHLVQGKLFEAQRFSKLAEKYTGHYSEEMGWVNKFIGRILDLGGEVKVEDQKGETLISDPVEYIKADLEIQKKGVEFLRDCMQTLTEDPTTYEIMKAYLADEEEDLYWSQDQLELIEKIGLQNWLALQL